MKEDIIIFLTNLEYFKVIDLLRSINSSNCYLILIYPAVILTTDSRLLMTSIELMVTLFSCSIKRK